jgi:lyso-ornithine lipid O-acyltransferase
MLFAGFVVVTFMPLSFLIVIGVRSLPQRRKIHSRLASFYSRLCLLVLGAKVRIINPPKTSQHFLFVSNHLGIVDIFLISSVRPSLFITSVELRETPLIGPISEFAGCLYVERRSRSNIQNEVRWIRQALHEGNNIVLFPEAAAKPGDKVYPFKRTLLSAAAGTSAPIMPVVLNYRKVNGEPMSHHWRDHLFWYGDQTFYSVLWKTVHLRSFEVDIEFLQPVVCHNEEQRHEISEKLHALVQSRYTPIPFP